MNINHKIWTGFGTVLGLVGVGCALGFLSSRKAEQSSTVLVRQYLAEYAAAKTTDEAMAEARFFEERFMLRKNETDVATAKARVGIVQSQMKTLGEVSTDTARKEQAAKIAAGALAYATGLDGVQQLLVRRGLTPDKGLEGELRKAVHIVEGKVKELGRAELNVLLLLVRRHEKDYLLREDAKYLEEIGTRIREFEAQLQKAGFAPELQKEMMTQWRAYADAMSALVEGDKQVRQKRAELQRVCDELLAAINELSEACSRDISVVQTSTLGTLAAGKQNNIYVGIASAVIGLGMAFWIMFSLRSLNGGIKKATDLIGSGTAEILSASGQLANASQTLASGASEQVSALEETSASLEEMSSMTKRNAENAGQAKETAAQARSAAETGAGDVDEMKRAMDAIKRSSDDISKIIKAIDEIAFQTNILALNAAVEAARAGEAGMGFAVVADEVRNLAQRAAQSARETAGKIEESVTCSEAGVRICNKVAESLADIVGKARHVDQLVAEIAQASQEQSQGIAQLNAAVSQIDKVTQTNASSAEESASASEELNAQATMLRETVSGLLTLVGGSEKTEKPAGGATEAAGAAAVVEPTAARKPRPLARKLKTGRKFTTTSSSAANSADLEPELSFRD